MKTLGYCCVAVLALLVATDPLFAQEGEGQIFRGVIAAAAGLGAGLTLLGAAMGFGRIGASALESMARQPETAGQVQTAMLIIAALLEGATFFSLIVCIVMAFKA